MSDPRPGFRTEMEAIVAKVKDPVCGMEFDSEKSEHKSQFKGRAYYFCCPKCKAAFDREPHRYAVD